MTFYLLVFFFLMFCYCSILLVYDIKYCEMMDDSLSVSWFCFFNFLFLPYDSFQLVSFFFFGLIIQFSLSLLYYLNLILFIILSLMSHLLIVRNVRLHGLRDNMPILISQIRIISGKLCIVLLLGCVILSFQFVLIQSLHCVLLLKLAKVLILLLCQFLLFLAISVN